MNRYGHLRHALAGALLLAAAGSAQAVVIDFEGASGLASTDGAFIDVDGFRFTLTQGNANGFLRIINQSDIVEPNTTKLFAANHAVITMTRISGGSFDLLSVDVGGSFVNSPNRWADTVNIVGGPLEIVTLAGQGPNYVTAVTNYLGVSSVVFRPTQNTNGGTNNWEYVIDNLVLDKVQVPEPMSASLAAFGLLVAVGVRRRARG